MRRMVKALSQSRRLRAWPAVLAAALLVGGMARAAGVEAVLFTDGFDRTTGLGSAWTVPAGAFSTNGAAALGLRPTSYAFWVGTPPADVMASVRLPSPMPSTYVGVTARGAPSSPDADHYAAYVGPDGLIGLSRRRGWGYTLLAMGPRFPSGAHVLALSVKGTQPVVLSVLLDGGEVIRYSDSSTSALSSGRAGIFDYNGASAPIDAFTVSDLAPAPPPAFDEATARRVLDVAGQKLAHTASVTAPTQYPKSTRSDGTWTTIPNTDLVGWTQGFFPGALWYMFENSGQSPWRSSADVWTRNLEVQKTNTLTHDLGPKLFYSFGQAYRLTNDPYYRDVLLVGAESLATRYHPEVGFISCCDWNPDWKLPLVVDTMISLEMLIWAADHGGRPELRQMAITHALTTLRELVRADGSTYHVVDFEPSTGAVRFRGTYQGYSNSSTWTRGQAWVMYGFTMMYRYTRDDRMLQAARKVTDYYLQHLPADLVPNWDFDAPSQHKDSSAAAIAASTLLELSALETGASNKTRYRDAALRMMGSLASTAYLAPSSTDGLLLHGVGHLPANQEIDVSLIYGDYFLIEAVTRFLLGPPGPVAPRVTVVSPNGGESLAAGQVASIRWTSVGPVPNVKLEWSANGGSTWQVIQASAANTGRFDWTVPATATTQGKVRGSSVLDPSVTDTSDGVFTIITGPPTNIVFSDDFNRTGALGASWLVQRGAFSANGTAAIGTAPQSYAFWRGAPLATDVARVTLATPLRSTYAGVITHAVPSAPDRDHYATYVGPDSRVHLARRNGWTYTYLADGPAFPSGRHVLGISATGTGPVTVSVSLDGTEIIRFVDSGSGALPAAGMIGMFDYSGASQPLDTFQVIRP